MSIEKITKNILAKYYNFTKIFSKNLVMQLLNCLSIKKHTINLKWGKQMLYKPINNLKLVKLKTLKTYIESNLANSFIQQFKSTARTLIRFVIKSNSSFYLYINYQDPSNVSIENWYLILLINKLLNQLTFVKYFV